MDVPSHRSSYLSLLLLVLSGCSNATSASSPGSATVPCGLTLTYSGPTAAGTFRGLNESGTQCQAASWRAIYQTAAIPDGSVFVSTSCDGQRAEGSLDQPYCDLATALRAVSARDFRSSDLTATIHVDPGTYTLGETLTTQSARVVIAGLCSTTVILQSTSAETALLTLNSPSGRLKIEGVTLSGNATALVRVRQGTATLANVRVESGGDNTCFLVEDSSATLIAQALDVDGHATTSLTFTQPTAPSTSDAMIVMPIVPNSAAACIRVSGGGQLQLDNFHLHDLTNAALVVEGAGSSADLRDGVVEQVTTNADGDYGYGVAIQDAAAATFEHVTVANTYGAGVMADGSDTVVTVASSHLSATASNLLSGSGVGIIVQRTATATITDSAITDHAAAGAYVSAGGTATIDASQLSGSSLNVAVANGTLTLTESTISDAQLNPSFGGRVGVFVESLTAETPAAVVLTGNIIRDNPQAGFYLVDVGYDNITATMQNNDFIDNAGNTGVTWTATVLDAATGTTMTGNCFQSLGDVALLLDQSGGQLSNNIYQGTYDTFAIEQQRCGTAIPSVTTTTESVTTGDPLCVCGIRSDTGAACSPLPTGPSILHDFGIDEVTVVQ